MAIQLHHGDCLSVLETMPDNSIDSCVTDPPYELGFMGKKWDSTGIAYNVELWRQMKRVLKPGAHLLAFSGTRTYHRMACAIEDAGCEIRDQLQWIYGKGFPKSMDISKAIDKAAGATREVTGYKPAGMGTGKSYGMFQAEGDNASAAKVVAVTTPSTVQAAQWEGWGTGLKPANEPICLARKPLSEGTIQANVLSWGTGGINIDGSRHADSRFPSNVIIDEFVSATLAEKGCYFYCPKASKRDRGVGNVHPTVKPIALMNHLVTLVTPPNGTILDPFLGSGTTGVAAVRSGFSFVGIEREESYFEIANARIKGYSAWQN